MSAVIIPAAFLGLLLGWLAHFIMSEQQRRAHLRQTNAQLKQGGEVSDRFIACANMVHRDALRELEGGDMEAAKRTLSSSVANFYHIYARGRRELAAQGIVVGPPDLVADELRAVERDATTSELLQRALKNIAEPGTSPNGGPAKPSGSSGGIGGPPSVS